MLAVAFFALAGLIIGGGIGYAAGHVDGMREGWQQGLAEQFDRQLEAAQRTWAVSPCERPPFDWAQVESRSHRLAGEQTRWPAG